MLTSSVASWHGDFKGPCIPGSPAALPCQRGRTGVGRGAQRQGGAVRTLLGGLLPSPAPPPPTLPRPPLPYPALPSPPPPTLCLPSSGNGPASDVVIMYSFCVSRRGGP